MELGDQEIGFKFRGGYQNIFSTNLERLFREVISSYLFSLYSLYLLILFTDELNDNLKSFKPINHIKYNFLS